jgi:hypothetical protein
MNRVTTRAVSGRNFSADVWMQNSTPMRIYGAQGGMETGFFNPRVRRFLPLVLIHQYSILVSYSPATDVIQSLRQTASLNVTPIAVT